MNLIEKAIAQCTPSKPIFKIAKLPLFDHNVASFSLQSAAYKGKEETGIEQLVARYYDQTFNGRGYESSVSSIVVSCRSSIGNTFVEFLTDHMEQMHPLETKIGSFYEHSVITIKHSELENALMSLYNFYEDTRDVINTMKVLEFLFIKYGDDFPDRPKRKRKKKRA